MVKINIRASLIVFAAISFFFAFKVEAVVLNNLPDSGAYSTNDAVKGRIFDSEGNMYIYGDFTEIIENADKAIGLGIVNKDTGANIASGLDVNGTIHTVVMDGQGGYYIGGVFNSVSGQFRNHIAHINANGELDPVFKPDVSGGNAFVRGILLSGNDLYISGNFTNVDGQIRNYFAKLDATSGSLDSSFNPGFNGAPLAMSVIGSYLYTGGSFTDIGGVARNYLARFSLDGQLDLTFNPNLTGSTVGAIIELDSSVYVCGVFSKVGAITRNNIAKFNADGSLDASFNPNFNAAVQSCSSSGSDIYAVGSFTTVVSAGTTTAVTHNRMAKLNASGIVDHVFNPNFNGIISDISISGSDIYVGGQFMTVASAGTTTAVTHGRVAKLNASGIVDHSFAPNFNNTVLNLAVYGPNLYIGGWFSALSAGHSPSYLAKFNAAGVLDETFNPIFNSSIYSMVISGSDLYAAGNFTSVASAGTTTATTHNRLAKLNTSGIVDHTFNPNFNNYINFIGLSGLNIYAGGIFTTVASAGTTTAITHNRIAKLNASGIVDHAFNPNFNNVIQMLYISDPDIYVGGTFTTAASAGTTTAVTHNRLAKLNTSGIVDHTFTPNLNNAANSNFAISGSSLFIGGPFTGVTPYSTSTPLVDYIAKLNKDTGVVDSSFAPVLDGRVSSLLVDGSDLYILGQFTRVNGVIRDYLAKLDTSGNVDVNFTPSYGGYTGNSLSIFNSRLYVDSSYTPFLTHFSPDTLAPALTLSGRELISLNRGTSYTDAGATALDANFGNLSSSISTNNPVDINRPGTYLITYTITDAAGNTSTATRTVTVNANESLPSVAISYTPFFLTPSAPLATSTSATSTLSITIEPVISSTSGASTTPEYSSSTSSSSTTPISVSSSSISSSLSSRLSGRILLQVESHGEAWYVNPDNNKRYYLGRPDDAFTLMRELGLGATTRDINSFINSSAPSRLSGKILLQVQDKGQAFYVSPTDLKLYYLGRPADAFALMRAKGLGITNGDLEKIREMKLD